MISFLKKHLLLFFLHISLFLNSQNKTIDSLTNCLIHSKLDTQKVNILQELCRKHLFSDSKKALSYGKQALSLSKELNYKKGSAKALHNLGIVHYNDGSYDTAIRFFNGSLVIKKSLGDKKGMASSYNNIGSIFSQQGNDTKALGYYLSSFRINEELKNNDGALSAAINIGTILCDKHNLQGAIKYYKIGLSYAVKADNLIGIADANHNIGDAKYQMKQTDSAMFYYKKALPLYLQEDRKDRMANSYMAIGELFGDKNQLDSALFYFLKSKEIRKSIDNKEGLAQIYQHIGKIYVTKNNYADAEQYFLDGLSYAKELGVKLFESIYYKSLAKLYANEENFSKAYKYQTLYNETQDSLVSKESIKQVAEMSARYEIEQKEKDNQVLVLKAQNEKQLFYFALGSCLFLVIILFFILRGYYLKQKSLTKEQTLNELKSQFISTASHEFLTPLTTIITSTELIEKYLNTNEIEKKLNHVNKIKTSVLTLKSIFSDFLTKEKIKHGKIINSPQLMNIKECIEHITVTNSTYYTKHKLIYTHSGVYTGVYLDKAILTTIITNLISNACKYSSIESEITILSNQQENSISISIKDEGIGIPKKDQAFLFEPFYRATNVSNIGGTGLGLNITKKLLTLIGGKLTFTSEENIGTTFNINIPL